MVCDRASILEVKPIHIGPTPKATLSIIPEIPITTKTIKQVATTPKLITMTANIAAKESSAANDQKWSVKPIILLLLEWLG